MPMLSSRILTLAQPSLRHHARPLFARRLYSSYTNSSSDNLAKQVPYTSESHPHLQRDSRFKKLTSEDIHYFKSVLPPNSVLEADGVNYTEEDLLPYNQDWFKTYRGNSKVVLKPRTVTEVSDILKYCNNEGLAVVPQGGNTSVCGASVPVFDEIVINTSNMNKIRSFDALSGVVTCDAGCILENLDDYLAERNYMVPLDLGAKGCCQIGGNISTNAGGIRFLRYGSLRGNVLGLEAVLPDGTILDNMSTLRKDNTGYDLKQLLIGAEGTLGMVTGVSLLTPRRLKVINAVLFGLNSFDQVQETFVKAKDKLNEILSAFEFWDEPSLYYGQHLTSKDYRVPLEKKYPFYVLVETRGSHEEHDRQKLEAFIEDLFDQGQIGDGVIAQDVAQFNNLWSIRDSLGESWGGGMPMYKYDLGLPVPVLYKIVENLRERLQHHGVLGPNGPAKHVTGFGHIGDGNLHLGIFAERYDDKLASLIEPYVFEFVEKYNGSVTAEHGLGIKNSTFIGYSKSPAMVNLMRSMKSELDPKGIMNPYKVL
ncbi:D-lactate dehydrogenase [Basidiobolus meristosporus CBS 931.73]|uniref:D-lactate dehydrogenase n=1 Tax=Basidiobolus meristosporus CBS 931.73 TaxID=1314790 RepID=A0A1Y1Y2E8_9FUNG|nr:D-lactate dehydrogenase [Basidiobolus meristosporus CBS 931.73]|eukprot:ORX91794.1 D-lactate dehydrogenase [Basidiobolus meristosporus CBS 931.73]